MSGSRAGIVVLVAALVVTGSGVVIASESKKAPDLSGEWRSDPTKSDTPGMRGGGPGGRGGRGGGGGGGRRGGGGFPGGGGGGFRRGGGGGGGERGAEGGPGGGGGGMSGMRLPELLRVTESDSDVRIADSTGSVVALITTGAHPDTTLPAGAERFVGQWKGDRLEESHRTERGANITRTFRLQENGQLLEIRTKIEPEDGSMRTMDFKRVYRKVGSR